mmetsp:Transcript_11281/g.34531  ORF Transcript_11281/g.34531 Transcript_11281/m.34531 type:complete len:178 (-) Transcript_11281:94-627(-)
MKSVVAVMAAVLLTLGVSAAVMNRDTTEESHVALSDDQMSVRYKAPSCCRAFRWISFLDDKDKYSVKQMLYNCRMDERAKKCKIDCSNQKTTQGCKCCCDMKEAMGILKGKNSAFRVARCKSRCGRKFTCDFPPGPKTDTITCSVGKCTSGYKCVMANGGSYCECVKDWQSFLGGKF